MAATIEEAQEQMLSMARSTNAAKVTIGWEAIEGGYFEVVYYIKKTTQQMSKLYVACMNCKRFDPDSPKSPTEGYGWCSRIKREISKWCMCGLGYEPKEKGGKQ